MDMQEIAERYRSRGETSREEILKDCIELAEADPVLRNRMVWKCGSVGEYAEQIYEIIKNNPPER